jgi:hypothetical protein
MIIGAPHSPRTTDQQLVAQVHTVHGQQISVPAMPTASGQIGPQPFQRGLHRLLVEQRDARHRSVSAYA